MEQIINKVKELKLKALEVIEKKMNESITCEELRILTQALSYIEEDKNIYSSTLVKFFDNSNKNTLSSGFNSGYYGVQNTKETEVNNNLNKE